MTVYLLHLEEPIGNPSTPYGLAQHYIGWSPEPAARVKKHAAGLGASLTAYAVQAGIGFQVAQTWEGGPELEKKLKRRKCAPRFCQVCKQLREERREVDELLAQMDWERELAEEAAEEPTWTGGSFSPIPEAEEAAETIQGE